MARFLPEVVQSVDDNIFNELEVIIIDDGSTDNTEEVINGIIKCTNCPVRYHKISHRGKSACINEIFTNLTPHGNYIVFMDADDLLPTDSLQQRYDAITSSGAEMIIGGFTITNLQGKILETREPDKSIRKEDLINRFFYAPKTPFHLNGTIISKELLFRTGPFNETLQRGQEMDYSLRLLKEARNFKILPGVVYLYRKYSRPLKLRLNIRLQNIYHRFRFINKHAEGVQKMKALILHMFFNTSKLVYDLFKNYSK